MHSVLIADDERVIRDGCRRVFESEGFRVVTASNGEEALEILRREDVDVILCDLIMPVMGAIEVLQDMAVNHPDVPLIIITGHGTVANAVECMRMGAYDFVTKPFRPDHLVMIAQRALEKQALERQAKRLKEERTKSLQDLAEEQSRVRSIVNCMADGVLVTNRSLEVVLQNPALSRLLGICLLDRSSSGLGEWLGNDGFVRVLEEVMERSGEEPELISREYSRGNVHMRALSAPVYGTEREVIGSVTVFTDITTFRALDEMKSSFVNMVSHELRSPLSTVAQQMTALIDGLAGGLEQKQREILGRSREKVLALIGLINDLLDVARIESGQGVQQQVPVDVGEMLADAVAFMQAKAQSQRVDLLLKSEPELPLVQADPRSMEEVLANLIANAVNYSPDGGRVTVSAAKRGDFLEISVSDTGIGIEPGEIPKIFDKFYRVKHPRTRQVIGTGLGLSIVKGIVESHRGSVEVESRPGVGSTFRVFLPVVLTGRGSNHAEE